MTAFIPHISNRPLLKELGINNMLKAVIYRRLEMNDSLERLTSIARQPISTSIKQKCLNFIGKQCKLMEITDDIKNRLSRIRRMSPKELRAAYQTGELEVLIQEADLLFEMHFRVKQSYTTFIYKYQRPSIQHTIVTKSMVA